MSPLNEQQQLQIRDERREQIMSAALKVFARRGIIGTKMSMIAAEAEISHGLLYHYFTSKEELFTTLVEKAMIASDEAMQNVYKLPGSPIDKIRVLTQDMMDESGTDYFLLIHQARTSDGVPEKVVELIERYSMDNYVKQLRALFREGQEAGEVAERDLDEMISSYLSVLSGLMVLNVQKIGGYQLPKVDVLLRMITP
ncbi:TetR/AcrR family transcriptional regulator [Paenibacillus chondroitinus]|uniref:TetR/AcrR family transcriptional regulator n=1 Tax=Paenibacillus chondroitinus TaxID=59842 RepID=A0ABU6DGA5_9BACL|nr:MULTISPECIES: TetR/AcrR family transcriptional regulator [Paenibacillus]MCY9659265.1 TetR/AcrR family transcriptional regulator [Paenibacillus anseongense]MEB4796400.1 TetR/AcrR family transcriptional regulator [Paenibacillus chondroitinus]